MKSLFPYLKSCFPPIQGLCLIFSHPLFLHLIVAMGSKIPNFLAFLCRTYNIIQNSYAPKGAIALLRSPFLTGLSGGVGSSSSVSTKNFLLWPVREPWKMRWVNRHFDFKTLRLNIFIIYFMTHQWKIAHTKVWLLSVPSFKWCILIDISFCFSYFKFLKYYYL